MDSLQQEVRAFLNRFFFDCFEARDLVGALSAVTEDIFCIPIGLQTPVSGKEGFAGFLMGEWAKMPYCAHIKLLSLEPVAGEMEKELEIFSALQLSNTDKESAYNCALCLTAALCRRRDRLLIRRFHLSKVKSESAEFASFVRSEELSIVADHLPIGICKVAFDEQYTMLYSNQAFLTLCDLSPLEFSAKLQKEPHVRRVINNALSTGQPGFTLELRISLGSYASRWLQVKGLFSHEPPNLFLNCAVIDISEQKESEQALRIDEERFRIAFSQIDSTIFDYNILTRVMYHADRSAGLFGLGQYTENVPDSLVESGLIHPDSASEFLELYRLIREGEAPAASREIRSRLVSGDYLWCKITMTAIFDEERRPVRAIGVLEDLSKQKAMEEAYRREESYRSAILSDALCSYEANLTRNSILYADLKYLEQYTSACPTYYDDLITFSCETTVIPEDRPAYGATFNRHHMMLLFEGGANEQRLEYRSIMGDGSVAWVCKTCHLFLDPATSDVKGFLYIKNIDEQKRKELQLQYESEHDMLTNLYSKNIAETTIREFLPNQPADVSHALLIIDLDSFKEVNDHCGHLSGDHALTESANRISRLFRADDVIGRIGGDEFLVFLKNIRDSQVALMLAQKVCLAFEEPFHLDGRTVSITCSVGVAYYPLNGMVFEELYRKADIALYDAKKHGKNSFQRYQESMSESEWIPYTCSAIDKSPKTAAPFRE